MTFAVTFASSIFSTVVVPTSTIYGVSREVTILGTSLFVVGFAFGPILFGSISSFYGRKYPLFAGYFIFAIFQIPVAVAQNFYTIMICRFFGGFFGSAPLTIIGVMLTDMWDPIHRGYAQSIFVGSIFIGPVIAPIVGSFITASHLQWRWTEYITAMLAFFLGFVGFLVIPETSAPYILHQKAKTVRFDTKNWAVHAELDEKKLTVQTFFAEYVYKPLKMLLLEPILLALTLYMSLVYGILYIFLEVYPITFQQDRGLSPGIGSLPFAALAVGVVIGSLVVFLFTKLRLARRMRTEGHIVPEERLIPMIVGSLALPAGLFWFAWTSSPSITVFPQIMSGIPIGVGSVIVFTQASVYIEDVYQQHSVRLVCH